MMLRMKWVLASADEFDALMVGSWLTVQSLIREASHFNRPWSQNRQNSRPVPRSQWPSILAEAFWVELAAVSVAPAPGVNP